MRSITDARLIQVLSERKRQARRQNDCGVSLCESFDKDAELLRRPFLPRLLFPRFFPSLFRADGNRNASAAAR